MTRKPKFKPLITRVKLNPEQAVLSCTCYSGQIPKLVPGGPFQIMYGPSTWCAFNQGKVRTYADVGVNRQTDGTSVAGPLASS